MSISKHKRTIFDSLREALDDPETDPLSRKLYVALLERDRAGAEAAIKAMREGDAAEASQTLN